MCVFSCRFWHSVSLFNIGYMIRQKMISAKVDVYLFQALEEFCRVNNLRRNRVINDALAKYIDY